MSNASSKGWRAGTGRVKFTPDEPMWLAGYAVRKEPARGTLSDLHVTALALEDAQGAKLILASADIIAIPVAIADAAAAQVREHHPQVPRENFVFAATHTHYGPEIRLDKALFFNIPPQYAQKIPQAAANLTTAIASAIEQALNDLTPATLHVRHATATFAKNRRPGSDLVDHDVPILDIRSGDAIKALVFGYACHNLTIDPQDLRYSADWAGYARERLGCPSLFLAGCGADQDPHPRGSVELSKQHGAQLADAVKIALDVPANPVKPHLHVVMKSVPFEIQPVTHEWIEQSLASDDPPRRAKAQYLKERLERGEALESFYHAPMQVARLGDDLLMVFMSGEPVVEWSHKFKKLFADVAPHVWVAGYCNDMFGYIPTLRVQREGGYEGGRANLWSHLPAPWTESVEAAVTAGIQQLVRQVS